MTKSIIGTLGKKLLPFKHLASLVGRVGDQMELFWRENDHVNLVFGLVTVLHMHMS